MGDDSEEACGEDLRSCQGVWICHTIGMFLRAMGPIYATGQNSAASACQAWLESTTSATAENHSYGGLPEWLLW